MNKTEHQKSAIIKALKKSLGVVSSACEDVGVGRTTFYQWLKDDPEFKEEVDNISELAIDFVESKLYERISQGDTTAAIFYLKTKGKKRGYVEKSEVDHTTGGEKINKVQIEIIGTESKDTGQSDTTEDS